MFLVLVLVVVASQPGSIGLLLLCRHSPPLTIAFVVWFFKLYFSFFWRESCLLSVVFIWDLMCILVYTCWDLVGCG